MSDKKLIIPEEFMNPDAYASQENFEKETLTYFIKDSRDLEHIVFDGCHMMKAKDIENLADLSNLTHVEFNYCGDLENIDVLAKLPNLIYLRLENCLLEDYSIFKKLTNLTHLEVSENDGIEDINFLSNLTKLTHLDISCLYGFKGDISPLSNLTKLTHLNLSSTPITNIDVLGGLPNLHLVDITGCGEIENTDVLNKVDNFNGKALFEYLPGITYEGEWVSCRKEGVGKLTTNFIVYEGNFKDGVRSGKGIQNRNDGEEIYKGDFLQYAYHGKGKVTYDNGNTYEGDFVEGNFHGKGKATHGNGDTYEGDFVEGGRSGKGVYTYADSGDTYEGDWVEGDRTGKGVYTYGGNTYEGDFVEGNFHGKGKVTHGNGNTYEGDFVEGKKKGNGVFTWPDGSKFEGEFTGGHSYNEKANIDTGIFTWSDGEKFEGYCYNAMNNMNEFTLAHKPTMSADKLFEIAKSTSTDDKILKSISTRTDLDDNCREIVDLKLKLQDKSSENWIETSELSSKEWGRDTFESLCNDKDHLIRAATANNPFVPQELLIDMMKMEHVTFDEKWSILSNPSCPEELLKTFSKDTQNYSSSRLRKAVALHPSTPKEIVNKLLEDEYVWVREAAATNSTLKKDEIKKILEKMDKKYPSTHTYQIKSSYGYYGIVESSGGSVSMDDVIEAIQSGEDDWNSYAYSDFYQWSDAWQVYGPTTLVDAVVYPDGTEEGIDVKGKFEYDSFTVEEGSKDFDGEFFQVASSGEKGGWNYNDFELVGEFNPDCLTAIYDEEAPASEEIIKCYLYNNEEFEDDTEIEIDGEFDESTGKGIDIDFYVNTDDGLQVCDDFYDMRSEMEEKGLDPESEKDIRTYLKKKYNLSLDISFPEPAFDAKTVKEQWKFKTGGYVTSSPAVSDGIVYVGSHDKHLYAVDAKTGKEQWKFETDDWVGSSPTVSDGIVYVGSGDSYLYAVDAKTGKEQWKFETGSSISSSPFVQDGIVYCGSNDKHLYAVDAKTGKEQWKFETGGSVSFSPTVSDGIVYVGSYDNHLYAVDAKTGKEQWKFKTGDWVTSSPVVSDGVIYVGSRDNHLYAVDAKTGKEQWKFETGDWVTSSPTVSDGIVYVGSHDKHLYAVDAKTGKEQWKFETGDSIYSSPAVSDGIVYVGGYDKHLYALKMISPDEE